MARTGLIFDGDVGLYAPDTSEIRSSVAEDWVQAFYEADASALDTESTTPAGQLIDAQAAEIEAKNAAMLYLASQFNPKTAEGRWQDALGHIYFLERKKAEPTVVTCQIKGRKGTVIPYGALVKSSTGHVLLCNSSVTIGSGEFESEEAETTFRVIETGPIEIPAEHVSTIITSKSGWDSVGNAAAGVPGRDTETRSEFEARRAASVAANAHGSASALYGAVANIPGVVDVQVLENISSAPVSKYGVTVPPHGVTICVFGGEEADIAAAVYNKKGNGAATGGNTEITHIAADYNNAVYKYKILRPSPVNFWIKVTLGANTSITSKQNSALKEALYTDFYGRNIISGNNRIGLASTVYASRFYTPALAVEGVSNIQSIEIALGADASSGLDYKDMLLINGNEEPTLSMNNIIISNT